MIYSKKKRRYKMLDNISFEFLLLIIFLISMYFDMTDSGVYYSKIILIGIMFIVFIIKNKKIYIQQNIWIYFCFSIMICFSGVYAKDNSTALGNIIVVISNLILMIIMQNIISSKRHIDIYLLIAIIFAIVLSLRVISVTDIQRLLNGNYYPDVVLQKYIGNRNVIALILGISLNFALYELYNYKSYKTIIPIIIIFIAILFTGSRKGILICVIPWVLFFLIKLIESKSILNKVKFILGGIVLSILVFNMTMKVEVIYNVIGFRMEAIYREIVYGEESTESSFNTRQNMVDKGLEYFKERPLLGYGVSNYRYLYKHDMGKETYSHNNYIELLVNNGIIGFLLYYLFYISALINTNYKRLKSISKQESSYYLMMICILICMLVLDISNVSYNSYLIYILLGMSMKRLDNEYC